MKPNDSSSNQNIVLKCKPFTVLSAVSSPLSLKVAPTRRSTRISNSSRANENKIAENQRRSSISERSRNRKPKPQIAVQCLNEGDDDFSDLEIRTPNKRRIQNRIQSSDDEDNFVNQKTKSPKSKKRQIQTSDDSEDNFVIPKTKSPKSNEIRLPKKGRSQNQIQSSEGEDNFVIPKTKSPKSQKRRSRDNNHSDDEIEPKRKTPTKRRKPLLRIKCNKMTDYYAKVTKPTSNEEQIPKVPETPGPETPPLDVIVLSSSEEHDEAIEQNDVNVTNPSPMPCSPRQNIQPKKCPDYKIVEGTNFAVDAFCFGEMADITTYFLTHFHKDHYVGLNKKFQRPIYMSTITGRLVKSILKVNSKLIKTMIVNRKYVIDGIEVTPIDANHCPGAVMFIFKLPCGRTILHTGDFRATPEMESNPVFWNNNFSTIYLDTTYLHKSYNFCTQNDVLLYVEDEVKKFKAKNIGTKFLIVVGSYVIGKEKVWCHIAQTFGMKVWLETERRKAFDLIYSEENQNQVIKDCVCDVRDEAQLHVIPIQCINYSFLVDYLNNNFKGHNLLAFRPTGWAKNASPQYGGRISIVGVQYSEHSSYSELKRFVQFIQPEKVISTVPISSTNPNTQTVPNKWLIPTNPMTTSQTTVTSYMKVRKNTCLVDKSNDKCIPPSTSSKQRVRDSASDYSSMDTDYMP